MAAEDRAIVKTSVPRYQKTEWTEHADRLDMSQSEFVATMVQAGRKGLEPEPLESRSPDANPRGNALEDRVLALLVQHDSLTFEEIVETVTQDIERQIDDLLQAFRDDGRVSFSNLDGYRLLEGAHGDD